MTNELALKAAREAVAQRVERAGYRTATQASKAKKIRAGEADTMSDIAIALAAIHQYIAMGGDGQNERFEAFVILNAQGEVWTPYVFHTELDARKILEQERQSSWSKGMLDSHTVGPCTVTVTLPAAPQLKGGE